MFSFTLDHFGSKDGHFIGCVSAYANLITFDAENLYDDVVTNRDCLSDFAGENEHSEVHFV